MIEIGAFLTGSLWVILGIGPVLGGWFTGTHVVVGGLCCCVIGILQVKASVAFERASSGSELKSAARSLILPTLLAIAFVAIALLDGRTDLLMRVTFTVVLTTECALLLGAAYHANTVNDA